MTQTGPWSVKGIDSRAREAAREAAREEGLTLGAYLNKLILEEGSVDFGSIPGATQATHTSATPYPQDEPVYNRAPRQEVAATALDRLTRRIESAEARSTLAITGIDQSVVGLLSRLENAEHSQQAFGNHIDSVLEDVRTTHESLRDKVAQLEADDSAASNLAALKSLEEALGKLASHVYEENALAGEEASAIKMRLETGLSELSERVDQTDHRLEANLDAAKQDLQSVVDGAELRAEGANRLLTEQFSALEMHVADQLSHVEGLGEKMNGVHSEMNEAIGAMGGSIDAIHERLSRAETTTDTALKQLEETFSNLDSRLSDVAQYANAETANELRRQFEERFDGLADELRSVVATARAEMAEEIEAATKAVDANVISQLEQSVSDMGTRLDATEDLHAQTMEMVGDTVNRVTESVDQRLTANQDQQTRAIEQIGTQVSRISETFDKRLETVEQAAATNDAVREEMLRFTETIDARMEQLESLDSAALDRISGEVEQLADRLDERVATSEQRSAAAIEQVGEQVASVVARIDQRQENALKAFSDKLEANQKRQAERLSHALTNVSDRLEQMQQQSISTISPVQKAIASLAQRIEAIEDFATPPYAEKGNVPELPDMVAPQAIDTTLPSAEMSAGSETGITDFEELSAAPPPPAANVEEFEETFRAGLENWTEEANAMLDAALDPVADRPEETLASEPSVPPVLKDHEYFSELPEPDLPWADGGNEARDSDIFDDEPLAEPTAAFDDPEPEFSDNTDAFETAAAPVAEPEETGSSEQDYLSQARAAAVAAAEASEKPGSGRNGKKKPSGDAVSSRVPTIAAVSALAFATAGTAGYLYVRGKQAEPPLSLGAQNDGKLSPLRLASLIGGDSGNETVTPLESAQPDARPMDRLSLLSASLDDAVDTTPAPQPIPIAEPVKTATTLQDAAEAGHPVAMYQLGLKDLEAGNITSAAEWIQNAASEGLPAAQYRLAKLHEQGLGVARDVREARAWTQRAANGGNVKAMHDLAVFMTEGDGGEQSYTSAVEWYRQAAEFGVVDSQFNLAVFFQDGLGVSPSLTEALFWFEVAARQGDKDAASSVQDLRERVSSVAAQQIRQRAQNWSAKTPDAAANGTFASQSWNAGPTPDEIIAIQNRLMALGYDVGTADGALGEQTRSAIEAFEALHGLSPTGQINGQFIEQLNAPTARARG